LKARALALAKTTKFVEKRDAATLGGPEPASAATPHPPASALLQKPLILLNRKGQPHRIKRGTRWPARNRPRRSCIANWSALRKPSPKTTKRNPPTGVNINVVFTTEEANSPTAGMKIILMIARIVRGRSYRRISDERNVIWQTVRRDIDAIRSVTFK
jgi:hypothetical protein